MFNGPAGQSDVYPDISIEAFYDYLGDDFDLNTLTLEQLKSFRMVLTDVEGAPGRSYGFYRSLIFDAQPAGEQVLYHLNEGDWYKAEMSFVERLKTYLDAKCELTDLCAYNHDGVKDGKAVYSEGNYNAAVPGWQGRFICLDQTDISPAGSTNIEPCDLYSVSADAQAVSGHRASLYHLKISTRSSHLSHLFNQGVNSIELIELEETSRDKMKQLVTDRLGANDQATYHGPLDHFDFRVVFGIITHKDAAAQSDNLPLFSKISLMRNMQRLDVMRIPCALTFIPDESPAKGGHDKHQQFLVEVQAGANGNEVKACPGQGLDTVVPIKRCPKVIKESAVGTRSVAGTHTRRPDIVGFVNGIPLLVIEAKRPDSGNPNKSMVEEGISQMIRNQGQEEIPHLFAYAHLLMSIGMTDGRYGTTRTPKKFWAQWREEEYDEDHFMRIKNEAQAIDPRTALLTHQSHGVRDHFQQLWGKEQAVTGQDRLLVSMCTPERLLDLVRAFILFDRKVDKIVARHQQYFGIRALLAQISGIKPDGARQGGVIWHTTGSGKSFTMVMLCKALLLDAALAACRLIVVTDRRDLEKQLAGNFLTGGAFGSDVASKDAAKAKAQSGRDLARRIGKSHERIIFTIINKFGSAARFPECHNDTADMIVLVDEGHRSQGGENHERMRHALPNAAYVAFTGTPLIKDDKTANKFGKIVHAYTMQDAVTDGTVTPLLYEERKPILDVNEKAIDNWFEKITLGLSNKQKSDLKQKFGKKGSIYGSDNRIALIALDIATHFKTNFKDLDLGLKGQLATDSKRSAIRYKKALDATGLVSSAIVISPPDTREGHSEVDEAELPEVLQWWKDNVKVDPEEYERQIIEDFGTEGRPDILIVVDKLLTGFDEPRNAVLYIDKKLEQHNLIQAIARVNRLHEQKKYGLLIDYRGILKELDTALTEYQNLADQTQGGFDIDDIENLYTNVSTEYKRLPALHSALWGLFASVKNKADIEQYRQILVPHLSDQPDGEAIDLNQKVREDFFEALTAFGMCLRVALGSRSFYEDPSISDQQIGIYKRDLKFFTNLRKIVKQDAQETVDFSVYEDQIRKLVDRYVIGEDVQNVDGVLIVNELGKQAAPETWSPEKTRNETDIIRSRIRKTIEQELADDPYAQLYFSQLLKQAIAEASSLFEHPYKQFVLFKDLEEKLANREVAGLPDTLTNRPHASAYFGVMRMELGEQTVRGEDRAKYVTTALEIETAVNNAVAENSLNPQNIEAAIRKALLPTLFVLAGLDKAKSITERIVEITRIGIARGGRA